MNNNGPVDPWRRRLFRTFALLGGGVFALKANAHHSETHLEARSTHRIVYQCNRIESNYIEHILFSVAELIRKYGDDIEIVVAVFGPAIHVLGKQPRRPVNEDIKARIRSLAAYGVSFHACGNTMKSLNWAEKDMLPFAKIVAIGVDDIMKLQQNGFAYLSW